LVADFRRVPPGRPRLESFLPMVSSDPRNATCLHAIGFWRCEDARIVFPHPKELVDPRWDLEERRRVADYLRHGRSLGANMGYSYCRFPQGPSDEEMGCADLTDGIWVWPEGLYHYVERYAVRLPEEFCRHAAQIGYRIPADAAADHLVELPFSFGRWIEWSNSNRSNKALAVLSRILVALGRTRPSPR
jgi:hypothetical protein